MKYFVDVDSAEKRNLEAFTDKEVFCIGTLGCNLQCSWCLNRLSWLGEDKRGYDRTKADILKCFDNLSPEKVIIGFGYNEPTTNPETFEIAKEAKKRGFSTYLATNGIGIDSSKMRFIIDLFDFIDLGIKAPPLTDLRKHTKIGGFDYDRQIIKFLREMRLFRKKINLTLLWIPKFVNGKEHEYLDYIDLLESGSSVHLRAFAPTSSEIHEELGFSTPEEIKSFAGEYLKKSRNNIGIFVDPNHLH